MFKSRITFNSSDFVFSFSHEGFVGNVVFNNRDLLVNAEISNKNF